MSELRNAFSEYHIERLARKPKRPAYPSFQYCSPLHQALENVGYSLYQGHYAGRYTARCFLVEPTGDFQCKDIGRSIYKPRPLSDEEQAMLERARARWADEPQYVVGRGGNSYPAEFVEMFPYSYGGFR